MPSHLTLSKRIKFWKSSLLQYQTEEAQSTKIGNTSSKVCHQNKSWVLTLEWVGWVLADSQQIGGRALGMLLLLMMVGVFVHNQTVGCCEAASGCLRCAMAASLWCESLLRWGQVWRRGGRVAHLSCRVPSYCPADVKRSVLENFWVRINFNWARMCKVMLNSKFVPLCLFGQACDIGVLVDGRAGRAGGE